MRSPLADMRKGSQRDIEREHGIRCGVLSAYENGRRKPKDDTAKRLARFYGNKPGGLDPEEFKRYCELARQMREAEEREKATTTAAS